MKTSKEKRNKINLLLSSFLVIGYVICAGFFTSLARTLPGTAGSLIQIAIMFVFGLLLFYATRVGDGKQIKRFSLAVLLLIDVPALYIILAGLIPTLPLAGLINPVVKTAQSVLVETQTASNATLSIIVLLAAVALGYGLPYTFFAGYEIKNEEEVELTEEEYKQLEGSLAAELAEKEEAEAAAEEATEEATEEAAEEATEEVTEEATEAVEEAAEETAEEAAEDEKEEKEEEKE